ncbi:hypothetical protein BN1723_002471 [Verticillium longisporum]|uniref:Transcription factor domain-containing protein n=1 Tax=Verticillium longisporum TaxID=100787 RepID=A0A0G4L8Q6_VERLO|nr:hypothetical protein BN1723_002471 [Verticillium longisporum]
MDLGLVSQEDYNYSDTLFHPPANFLSTIETLFDAPPPIPKPLAPNLSLQPVDLMCSVSDTHRLLSLASQPTSEQKTMGQCLAPSCRRFITATLRTFPRLMAQPAKWPPFIHPLVSSLHFDERDIEPPPTPPQPLKPLAACRVISQGFVARSEGSMDFLWRSIEAEERWIKSDVSISPKRDGRDVQLTDAQMHKFSLGELLAAMQAMVIYTIMRMIDFGPDYFTEHDGMIVTMQDLAYVYSSRVPGPFSPPHERKVGLRWKDWLCEEVRRRIINTCFCVALVVGTGSTQGLANPGQGPLPGPSSLWEADNEWDWAREYMRSWGPQGNGSGKLFDMCSLALAMRQRVGSEGALVAMGESRLAEDALDEWQAGLDALGMMLSTIMVDSGGECRASIGM